MLTKLFNILVCYHMSRLGFSLGFLLLNAIGVVLLRGKAMSG